MNIEDLTLKQIRELQSLVTSNDKSSEAAYHSLVGENVIVRTVTMIYTGKLIGYDDKCLVLTDCSWIPETDRYMQFVAEGKVNECEPYPDGLPVYINTGALLELCELKAKLPRLQK